MNSVKKAQDEAVIAHEATKGVISLVDCSYRRGSCLYLAFWREWDRLEKEAKKQEIKDNAKVILIIITHANIN